MHLAQAHRPSLRAGSGIADSALEVEGFNTTPHIKQGAGLQGSHLRVTTLAFNVIARTKVGCRNRDEVRHREGVRHRKDGTVHDADDDRDYWSPLDENLRCPLQLYAGAGPGLFFAETSKKFGRSTDNARVGRRPSRPASGEFLDHIAEKVSESSGLRLEIKFRSTTTP